MGNSTDPEGEIVLSSLDDVGVLTLSLNRPHVLNAWIPPMQTALFDAFDTAATDPAVRVVVLTGTGKGFCPGVDMEYLGQLSAGTAERPAEPPETRPVTHATSIPKPIICSINGACAGIGLAVAMSCDIRFAANEATLTTAFAKLGLVAEHGLSWTLPRACGYATATELLMTARRFKGDEAAHLGVVHHALPADELVDHAAAYARQLAQDISPISFAAAKWQLGRTATQTLGEALGEANAIMAQTIGGPDFAEGVAAFTGRRAAAFAPLGQGTTIQFPP